MSLSIDLDIELSCANPGTFVRGGGSRSILQKSSDNLFFSPQLILQSQMVNFKENYHFSRFPRGSNIFQGGGGPTFSGMGVPIAYSYRKYITCDFPGEVRTPCPPPSGSALGTVHGTIHSCRECTKSD